MNVLNLIEKIENIYNLGLDCSVYESRRARHSRLTISRKEGLRIILPKRMWNKRGVMIDLLKTRENWITAHWQKVLKTKHFSLNEENIQIEGRRLTEEEAKEIAKIRISRRVFELANRFGYRYGQIKIRNQKRTWGTCHKNRNLSFNWRLILLPRELSDYIICHELTHLKVFNHSKAFWIALENICFGAKDLRKELKKYEY